MKKKTFIRKGKEVMTKFTAQSGAVEKTLLKVKKR